MMLALKRSAISLCCLCLLVTLLIMTTNLGATARLVPICVAVPTLVLVLWQLILEIVPALSRRWPAFERHELFGITRWLSQARQREGSSDVDESRASLERQFAVWLLLLLAMVWLLGMLIAAPLYTLLYIRSQAKAGWGPAAVMTTVAWLVVHVLSRMMGSPAWSRGIIWAWWIG